MTSRNCPYCSTLTTENSCTNELCSTFGKPFDDAEEFYTSPDDPLPEAPSPANQLTLSRQERSAFANELAASAGLLGFLSFVQNAVALGIAQTMVGTIVLVQFPLGLIAVILFCIGLYKANRGMARFFKASLWLGIVLNVGALGPLLLVIAQEPQKISGNVEYHVLAAVVLGFVTLSFQVLCLSRLASEKAAMFFGLICPKCESLYCGPADFSFRRVKCEICGEEWS